MEPPADRHLLDGEPDEPAPEVGLVELVDQALVRLDGLRDRPRLSSAVTALFVFLLVAGWGLTRWRAVEPIDDRIPRIGGATEVDGATVGDESGAAIDQDANRAAPGGAAEGVGATPPGDGDGTTASTTVVPADLVIHVSGEVRVEGLVEVPAGSRLADAITAAGGATAEADVHRLNLATPLADGMHVRVPTVGEEGEGSEPLIEHAGTVPAPSDADGGTPGPGSAVNVNQASAAELERLPGVGPAIAAAIISWRDENGPFATVDDLLDVPGIGPAKLAAMEDQVTL